MSKLPTVSVIIPTYNRSHLVGRAIQSVLNQTYQDFEIIVVDDGSKDNTDEVIKEFQKRDKRIKYIKHKENKGGSAARNTGIKIAKGKYIAFQDSDDEWMPKKLEKQICMFETLQSDIGVVYTGCLLKKTNDEFGEYYPLDGIHPKEGDLHNLFLKMNIVRTPTAMIKKECFSKVGLFDESLPRKQERDLWIRVSKYYKFKYVAGPLVIAYYHPYSISANSGILPEALKLILDKYYDEIKSDRKLLARYYYEIGTCLYQNGETKQGRNYLRKALISYPFEIKTILAFLVTLFGRETYCAARKLWHILMYR